MGRPPGRPRRPPDPPGSPLRAPGGPREPSDPSGSFQEARNPPKRLQKGPHAGEGWQCKPFQLVYSLPLQATPRTYHVQQEALELHLM